MDAVILSRVQFAIAAGFHFLFPPLTFGLSLLILIMESIYVRRDDEIYKNISDLLVKLLGIVFVLGTATGITLEFAFGTNWSNYSRMVGDIFGAPLAAEGVFAFFMESIFLGVLVFGRKKISKKMYLLSAFLVFFGAHLSGLWIIIANSFMQTPAGYEIVGGRAVLANFFAAAINHSTVVRYCHTLIAGWITGSLLAAGIAAWYLLKERHLKHAKILLRIALIVFISAGALQLVAGHLHSIQVARTQPEKLATFEGLWETKTGAPLNLFGIPQPSKEETHLKLGLPKLLSIFIYFNPNAEIKGLKEFPGTDRPPITLTFTMYHIMFLLEFLFLLMAAIGLYLLSTGKLWQARRYLWLLIFAIPLPHIANLTGWIAAEVGRQPWAVYKVLRTADAASVVVPAGQVLFTLIMFILIYALLLTVFIKLVLATIRKGPETITQYGY